MLMTCINRISIVNLILCSFEISRMTLDRKLLTGKTQHIKSTDKAQTIPYALMNKYPLAFFISRK
jgi:hypothetical protein